MHMPQHRIALQLISLQNANSIHYWKPMLFHGTTTVTTLWI